MLYSEDTINQKLNKIFAIQHQNKKEIKITPEPFGTMVLKSELFAKRTSKFVNKTEVVSWGDAAQLLIECYRNLF